MSNMDECIAHKRSLETLHRTVEGSNDDVSGLRVTPLQTTDRWFLHGQFLVAPLVSAEVDLRPALLVQAR
ncbi:hypothetical protein TNCV_1304981 [Trichonephila clavipes]|nr:hypothetical protein TNCV_1304981 [Trichonephila clavipes]